jgi:Kef-type K+ transport system membrane component KefB
MSSIFIVGIIIFVGFILGQEFQKRKLPKIIGYLISGVLLNPNICAFIPKNITAKTDIIENIAIAFIAFAVGGMMVFSEIKKLGKNILFITLFEAEVTFLFITAGFLIVLPLFVHIPGATMFATFIPVALLLGCLGSPTDPSVVLAVTHEYKAKGEVTSTMVNVAGFDDILGIINFSIAVVIAKVFVSKEQFSASQAFITPLFIILGSIMLGSFMGFIFNVISKRAEKQTEGVIFVLILSFITLCWGLATFLHAEEILSIMTMGIIVTNFNENRDKIFKMLERYSEELILLIFFTLSGMHLDFGVVATSALFLLFFVIFRIIGKFTGVYIGAKVANSSPLIKKYTASGLIPFGGIVIGLALIVQQNPAFGQIGKFLVNTIIGGAIINEFLGPFFVKHALRASREIEINK